MPFNATMEFSRSDVRLALRNLRDGRPFAPELMVRVVRAIRELRGNAIPDDGLSDAARELLLDRRHVQRLMILLNRKPAAH